MHRSHRIAVGLMAGLFLAVFACPLPSHAQNTANVTVNASNSLGTIPAAAFGVNTATWDGLMTDTALPPLLQALNINALRYPGGSWSDDYHWQDNSGTVGSGVTPNANDFFDNFMVLAKAVGASPVITCNYGSNEAGTAGGDPNEAAAWVNYANNTKQYGVKYWEIGNEVYGNGYYSASADWETDLHDTDTTPADRVGNANLSPTTYGTNVVTYVNAMKAEDPTIKVGAVLDLPSGSGMDWDPKVLAACGTKIDFVILHWYPEYDVDNDANLLGDPSDIVGFITQVRAWITQYCGTNAPNVQIFVTETNSDAGAPGKQMVGLVNAMFASDDYMTWLENGVSNVDWWDLHNGISTDGDNDPTLYGTADFGDEGILSNGSSSNGTSEPAAETPFAPYYGIEMLKYLGKPGDKMVSTTSNQTLITTHAVLQANGSLSLMLINKDPQNTYTTNVSLTGFMPTGTGTTYLYGQANTSIATSTTPTAASFSVSLPAYSITVVNMAPLAPLHVFSAGLQMIAAPETYVGDTWDQFLNPSTSELAIWVPGTSSYELDPTFPADTLRAGSGYWALFNAQTTIFDIGEKTDPTKSVFISLTPGWNMIGDPFTTPVDFSSLEVTVQGGNPIPFFSAASNGFFNSTMYDYPAGSTAYQKEFNSLSPYVGYWLWAKDPSVLIVPSPS